MKTQLPLSKSTKIRWVINLDSYAAGWEASTCGRQGVSPDESSSCGVNETFVATALEPVIEETESFETRQHDWQGLEHKHIDFKIIRWWRWKLWIHDDDMQMQRGSLWIHRSLWLSKGPVVWLSASKIWQRCFLEQRVHVNRMIAFLGPTHLDISWKQRWKHWTRTMGKSPVSILRQREEGNRRELCCVTPLMSNMEEEKIVFGMRMGCPVFFGFMLGGVDDPVPPNSWDPFKSLHDKHLMGWSGVYKSMFLKTHRLNLKNGTKLHIFLRCHLFFKKDANSITSCPPI